MRERLTCVGQLAVVLALAAAAIGIVDAPAVDWAEPVAWLDRQPADLVAAAALRLATLAAAWWVVASTAAYATARLVGVSWAVAAVGWVTLPAVRRMADRAAAVSLMGSTVMGGAVGPALAVASPDPPPTPPAAETVETRAPWQPALPPPSLDGQLDAPGDGGEAGQPAAEPGDAADDRDQDRDREEAGDPGARTSQGAAAGGGAASPDAPDPADTTDDGDSEVAGEHYRVQPGDHLWAIAEQALSDAWGRDPSVGEIDAYWRELIAANRDRLTSGDPDLIYPGEHLVVPDVHADPDPSKG